MLPNVYALLTASAAVTALVSTRIYRHGVAPQDVQAPYVTWFVVSGVPENHLSGTPPVDAISVQIDCWSVNTSGGDRQVQDLATAVRDAIEPYHHMTAVAVDGWDAETKRYRIGMTFTFWLERAA